MGGKIDFEDVGLVEVVLWEVNEEIGLLFVNVVYLGNFVFYLIGLGYCVVFVVVFL